MLHLFQSYFEILKKSCDYVKILGKYGKKFRRGS